MGYAYTLKAITNRASPLSVVTHLNFCFFHYLHHRRWKEVLLSPLYLFVCLDATWCRQWWRCTECRQSWRCSGGRWWLRCLKSLVLSVLLWCTECRPWWRCSGGRRWWRCFKSLVLSVLLSRCETWILTKDLRGRRLLRHQVSSENPCRSLVRLCLQ